MPSKGEPQPRQLARLRPTLPPPIGAVLAAERRLLHLGDRRQAIGMAGMAAEPGGIGGGVLEAHADHGVVVLLGDAGGAPFAAPTGLVEAGLPGEDRELGAGDRGLRDQRAVGERDERRAVGAIPDQPLVGLGQDELGPGGAEQGGEQGEPGEERAHLSRRARAGAARPRAGPGRRRPAAGCGPCPYPSVRRARRARAGRDWPGHRNCPGRPRA